METKLIAMLLCIVLSITSCSSARPVAEEPLEEIVPYIVRDERVPAYDRTVYRSFEGFEEELEAAVGAADGAPSDAKRTEGSFERPLSEDPPFEGMSRIQDEAIDAEAWAPYSDEAYVEQTYGTYFEPDEGDAVDVEASQEALQALSETPLEASDGHLAQGVSNSEHTDTDNHTDNPNEEKTDDSVVVPDGFSDEADEEEGNPSPSAEKDEERTFSKKAASFAKGLPVYVHASIGTALVAAATVCIAASKRRRRADENVHEDEDDIIQAFLTGNVSIVDPEPEGRAEPASPPGEESKEG